MHKVTSNTQLFNRIAQNLLNSKLLVLRAFSVMVILYFMFCYYCAEFLVSKLVRRFVRVFHDVSLLSVEA